MNRVSLAYCSLGLAVAACGAAVALPRIAPAEGALSNARIAALRAEARELAAYPTKLPDLEMQLSQLRAGRWTVARRQAFLQRIPAGWEMLYLGIEPNTPTSYRYELTRSQPSADQWSELLAIVADLEQEPGTTISRLSLSAAPSADGSFQACSVIAVLHFDPASLPPTR